MVTSGVATTEITMSTRLTGYSGANAHLPRLHREVAGDPVSGGGLGGAGGDLQQGWLLGAADLLGLPAAGVEVAAGRRVDRAGDVALQPDPLTVLPPPRVRDRDGREHRHGVGVARPLVEVVALGDLHDLAEVH